MYCIYLTLLEYNDAQQATKKSRYTGPGIQHSCTYEHERIPLDGAKATSSEHFED